MTDRKKWVAERDEVPDGLRANRERRERAREETDAARGELQRLLVRGQAVALGVAGMAREAGVSRETAHRLLREAARSLTVSAVQRAGDAAKARSERAGTPRCRPRR